MQFLLASLVLLLASCTSMTSGSSSPQIPVHLQKDIPAECHQVILVLADHLDATHAQLWLLERSASRPSWHTASTAIPVRIGRKGLAWGVGEHREPTPAGIPLKVEGDKRAPMGVFRLPYAFGYGADSSVTRLPYTQLRTEHAGVDDSNSRYYNQIIDSRTHTPDWERAEVMRRQDDRYRLGIFVDHNPKRAPHGGSCIFIHQWHHGAATSGCTAMSPESIELVLRWVDPQKHPRMVVGLKES